MFSFSNSSGVRASVALPFLVCLVLGAAGIEAEVALAATVGTVTVLVFVVCAVVDAEPSGMPTKGTLTGLIEEEETVAVDASDDGTEVADETS